MNSYIVSTSGIWPNEKYFYQIDRDVIDFRYTLLPIYVFMSPYYSEDHNFVQIDYNNVKLNTELISFSSNKPYLYTENTGDFNSVIETNLTYAWTPSSMRVKNYGNIFNYVLLKTSDENFFSIVNYPSELFLYPKEASVVNNYQTLSTEIQNIKLYTQQELTDFYTNLTSITALLSSNILSFPLVSSILFSVSSRTDFFSNNWETWYSETSSGVVNTYVGFSSSIDFDGYLVPLSSFTYVTLESGLKSYYTNSFILQQDLLEILSISEPLSTYCSHTILVNNITSVDYSTFYQILTSRNYTLQTSSVLIEPYNFQFYSDNYGNLIKKGHSNYLSTTPNILPLNNTNLKNLSYTLSGSIVNCNKKLIEYTENKNPIYENILLEKENSKIRPDTVKLAYNIQFLNTDSSIPNKIGNIGDIFDDVVFDSYKTIETSYIVSFNETKNVLAFQLLQSGIDLNFPMEHPINCVLSAFINLNNSRFEYYNQRFPDLDALNAAYTPISGVPNTNLYIRYIADTPYNQDNVFISNSILNLSSNYGGFSVNSAISLKTNDHVINWKLEYPPYYYNFKNSYTDNNNILFKDKNTLSFYLSSELISNETVRPDPNDTTLDYAKVDLYTSVYSDYDIIELPLKDYANDDLIKYELIFKNDFLLMENLSAYIVFAENFVDAIQTTNVQFYDIKNSPYIPAISGMYLRLIYDLEQGGTIFSIKPSLSTRIGLFDAFWATTFPVSLDYKIKNFIRTPPIETISRNVSSIVVSVAALTGNVAYAGLDLRGTELRWDYKNSEYPLSLINRSLGDVDFITEVSPNSSYLFDQVNTIEILGFADKPFDIVLYSQTYDISSVLNVDSDLFDLYSENQILLELEPLSLKNKIKIVKINAKIPFTDKVFNLSDSSKISWDWSLDDLFQNKTSAYYVNQTLNYELTSVSDVLSVGIPYDNNTVSLSLEASSLYFLIDSDFTLSEKNHVLSANVEVYDRGDFFNVLQTFDINSYPDPLIFSTNFFATYPNFPTFRIMDTGVGLKSLTRPPNNTNIFQLTPYDLKAENISISSIKWNIKSMIIPMSSIIEPYYKEETIILTPNVSGFYDDISLNWDFNLYAPVTKYYYNKEILIGTSAEKILNWSQFVELSSYLISSPFIGNSKIAVASISAFENTSPFASSLYVITTSFYNLTGAVFQDLQNIIELENLYSYSYIISSLTFTGIVTSLSSSGDIIEDEYIYDYDIYNINYWLSSSSFVISDNSTEIDTFSSTYIWQIDNILSYETFINPTSSFEYLLTIYYPENNAYVINDITFTAENVELLNWSNLYDFTAEAKIITTDFLEFNISPKLGVIPKHIWIPDWIKKSETETVSKKTNKFVTHIPDYDDNTYYTQITGLTYGNRLSCQEFHIILQEVQDFPIDVNVDPITIIVGVGNENFEILNTQIIDDPSEYSKYDDNNIEILDFRLPCLPEAYESSGMTVQVTAFNKYFPLEGGLSFYGLDSLSSTELSLLNYPITSKTFDRNLTGIDIFYKNPRLFEYEPVKLLFYPKLISVNLDTERRIQVKQILEVDPINAPNEIEVEKSSVTYNLMSDYWSVSTIVPAFSNQDFTLFRLSVGDPTIPLTISEFYPSTLVLTATAMVATKIQPTTFNKYNSSQYTGDRDIWGSVYQMVIGNSQDIGYKILFSEVNTLSTETGTMTAYDLFSINNNNLIISI